MRISPYLRKRPAGGVIILALVIVGFVTLAFTTWVSLLSQRGRVAEIEEHATRRRIAVYNSRAVIQEYALQRMITSSGDSDGVSFDPFSGWSVTSAAAWSGYSFASNTRLAGLNGFSPTWDYPYSKLLDVTAGTKALGFAGYNRSLSDTASYLKTYVRSRSLVLGGDLLVVHRSKLSPEGDPAVTGNINVLGRVMHFRPDLAATAYTGRSYRFVASPGTMNLRPKDVGGADIPPSNLTWVPLTFGAVGGVTDYSGKLNVIEDSTNGGNSLVQTLSSSAATLQNSSGSTPMTDPRGYSNPGSGIVTITPCIGASNPADLPSVIIKNEVQEIIIEGQTAPNLGTYARYRPAMAIVYVQDTTSVLKLTTVRLRNQGGRRMLLAIKQNGNVAGGNVNIIVEDTNSTSEWNLMILAENTPLTFSATSGASKISMPGGIETDSTLNAPGGSQVLELSLQGDTRGLIRMSPRAGWVETIMPEKIPGTSNDNTW